MLYFVHAAVMMVFVIVGMGRILSLVMMIMVVLIMVMIVMMGLILILIVMVGLSLIVIIIVMVGLSLILIMMVGLSLIVMVELSLILRIALCSFLRPMNENGHMGAADTAFNRFFLTECHAGYSQRVQSVHKLIRFRQQLQQRGGQHIPRGAHSAIQIKCFHFDTPSVFLHYFKEGVCTPPKRVFAPLSLLPPYG